MKNKVHKLDVDKLKPVPFDLKKLSHVVENDVVKKTVYDELVKKVNAIDTSKLVNKTDYDAKIKDVEDKIPIVTSFATTLALNKIPDALVL